jgi:hypothetical protein
MSAHAPLLLTGLRVEEDQLVGGGAGDDHRLVVGGRHQVMRLFAHVDLAGDGL